jgi:hypothetical protein
VVGASRAGTTATANDLTVIVDIEADVIVITLF